MIFRILASALLVSTCAIATPATDGFDLALRHHLAALLARDFPAFEKTISPGPVTLVLPNGRMTSTRQEYLSFIRSWFGETSWRLTYKPVSQQHTADMGYALLLVSYDDLDEHRKPYHLDHYLLLVFRRVDGVWYLVHDQNTKTTLSPLS